MVKVYTGKNRAVAVENLAKYQANVKKLTDEWGIGVSAIKKYNIEPYLKRQKAFEDALTKFEDLRNQYNDLGKKITAGNANPSTPPQRLIEWKEQRGKIGGDIQKLGNGQLEDIGAKFEKNLADFNSTLMKLINALGQVETKTMKQRNDLMEFVKFLRRVHTKLAGLAGTDYTSWVKGLIDDVKARVPII